MPGRRNFARERAQHALTAPATFAAIHATMVAQLPEHDRALIGPPAILAHLDALHIKRLNGRPLSWRIVKRWRIEHGFPFLPGCWSRQCRTPPLSTVYASTAWVLSRLASYDHTLFRLVSPQSPSHAHGADKGRRPTKNREAA